LVDGSRVLVVGALFSRKKRGGKDQVGVRAEQIVPLDGIGEVEPILRIVRACLSVCER